MIKKSIKNLLSKDFIYEYLPKYLKKILRPHKIFIHNKKLKYDKRGYWELKPNITIQELDVYYKNVYWTVNKASSKLSVKERDIVHLEYLRRFIDFDNINTFLNFGSGHGGVSVLLQFFGIKKIINVDPDVTVNYDIIKSNSFSKEHELSQIKDKIDFFYSSHSLEHVTEIDSFLYDLKNILAPGAFLFFEVPDCENNPVNGGFDGNIIIPHTYYFKKEFFSNLDFELLRVESDGLSIKALLKNI